MVNQISMGLASFLPRFMLAKRMRRAMKKPTISMLIAAAVSMIAASPLLAADASVTATAPLSAVKPFDVAFGIKLASDYNFRGISQTARGLGPNGYVELQFQDNLAYASVTGYRVRLPNRPSLELDYAAGVRPKLGPLTFDIGAIYYSYPGGKSLVDPVSNALVVPRNTNFLDYTARVTWAVNNSFSVGAGVFHSPDWLNTGARATYASVNAKLVLPQTVLPGALSVSGELASTSSEPVRVRSVE
jgi:uncharacterized protein (TIGR02001 family)